MRRRSVLTAFLFLGLVVSGLACGRLIPPAHGRPAALPGQHSEAYLASLRYARCMRAYGVPHPDPAPDGTFRLTRTQDERLQATPRARRQRADRACVHYIDRLDATPLSAHARARALQVLADVRRCLLAAGYDLGTPTVRSLGHGRAFFGFRNEKHLKSSPRLRTVEYRCEQRVQMARRIDRIVAADRIRSKL
jgi:hypothetical protein